MTHPLFYFINLSSSICLHRFFFIGLRGIYSEAFLLSDYSRIFTDIWPLANGWRPKGAAIGFVTQIPQMAQIFSSWEFFSPTDFTDFHRFFFMESLVNRFVFIGLRGVIGTFLLSDYSRIFADIWPLANGWRPKGAAIGLSRRFFFVGFFCPTDFTDFHRFFYGISGESLCPIPGGI